ncbi:hypothetical protein CN558_11095 [Bacillus wiedmannii]|uniref:SLH domain-containing protein n=1 Tax=Bacillus wiedmannii TaxID=1890302 RepID=A0A2C5PTC5_9BACI|nr:hypothetical protein CN690_20850 [Bacillus wiedmannii]PEL78965.1 hypothetical protein CN609_22805 [Bacillus wiedmannii]PEM31408.1 hypothetical protein CN598_10820 [Bacillus wiedmannii]PEM87006.1 hypothetical protein CN627_17015 [Bacillus wiedmannii]PEO86487.1 hypothetical protein CN558_11095 [Bacillus wiedmannii]
MIRGVSATKFTPYGTLTRQQAALMLERTLEYLGVEKESNIGSYHIAIKLIFCSTPKMKFLSIDSYLCKFGSF